MSGRNGGHLTALPRLEFATLVEACGGVEDAKRSVLLEDRAVSNVTDVCEKNGWEAEVELRTNGCVRALVNDPTRDESTDRVYTSTRFTSSKRKRQMRCNGQS